MKKIGNARRKQSSFPSKDFYNQFSLATLFFLILIIPLALLLVLTQNFEVRKKATEPQTVSPTPWPTPPGQCDPTGHPCGYQEQGGPYLTGVPNYNNVWACCHRECVDGICQTVANCTAPCQQFDQEENNQCPNQGDSCAPSTICGYTCPKPDFPPDLDVSGDCCESDTWPDNGCPDTHKGCYDGCCYNPPAGQPTEPPGDCTGCDWDCTQITPPAGLEFSGQCCECDPPDSGCPDTHPGCNDGCCYRSVNLTPSPTITPTPSAISVSFSVKFIGIDQQRANLQIKLKFKKEDGTSIVQQTETTASSQGVYSATVVPQDLLADNYSIFVKGPKHLARKVAENVTLNPGINTFDWTAVDLPPGDLPNPNIDWQQDGIINAVDRAWIDNCYGQTGDCLLIADLNLDDTINTMDANLFNNTIVNFDWEDEWD